MKKVLFALLLTSGTMLMISCGGKDKKDDDDYEDMTLADQSVFQLASYSHEDSTKAKSFGKSITADGAVNILNLAADPAKANGYTGKVTGVVTSVCHNKGCWMTLDTGSGEDMMVTFTDYGFFVPKDITGKTVIMEGKAEMRTVTVDEQKHLAGDAGKSQAEIDKITTAKQELRFVADGVLIR
ncbi:MAG: DUF4920 domain-containing protein [Chitinophagales bacterium]